MLALLEPADLLMFRDGRPFDQGEQHTAHTVFPPSPRTIHGALRAQMLRQAGLTEAEARLAMRGDRDVRGRLAPEFAELVGDATSPGGFRVIGAFGYRDTGNGLDVLLPAPLDLALPGGSADAAGQRWSRLRPATTPPPVRCSGSDKNTPLPAPLATHDGRSGDPPSAHLISGTELVAYLREPADDVELLGEEELVGRERRTGIKLEDRRAADGMLYEAEFLRFVPGGGVLAVVETMSKAARKALKSLAGAPVMLRLGGEGRMARAEFHDLPFPAGLLGEPLRQDLSQRMRANAGTVYCRVYLATECCWLHEGCESWYPASLLQRFIDCGARSPRLTGAAVGRFSVPGGWALVGREPRSAPMGEARTRFAAVPAGSVYHFAFGADQMALARILTELHGRPLSDRDSEYGYGLAFFGVSDRSPA